MTKRTKFSELKRVIEILHGPRGCPWDKKQTHKSIFPYFREEVGEFISAAKKKNYKHMEEELGDVLLQVMFHAQIASKSGRFDIEDVISHLVRKLKRRHPHVFGNTKVKSVREVLANWEKIKAREKIDNRRKR